MLTNTLPKFTKLIILSLILRLIYMGSGNLLAEEAYYWNYAQHLDFGYLDHPPMVAYLIKIFTGIFGTNEIGVRAGGLVCWGITAIFSFKLTELIKKGAGYYAVLLLSILPFFFIHSLIITPDLPLIACWSASLYYLYLCLVSDKKSSWYLAGLWLGLGLLSKYSIVLLGLATVLYMIFIAKNWFLRFEPYIAALIAICIFSPVIYWNAKHQWASFLFQSTRRLQEISHSSLPELIGLILAFLTPVGVYSFFKSLKNTPNLSLNEQHTRYFILIFTFVPLMVFAFFSLSHEIKFNWIGPTFLALIPLLAASMTSVNNLYKPWFITSIVLICCYSLIIFCIVSGKPKLVYRLALNKYIAWDALTLDFSTLAIELESKGYKNLRFIPLDRYNIGSELSFYQAKLLLNQKIDKTYPIIGSQIFGGESLMYSYWDKSVDHHGELAILISTYAERFSYPEVLKKSQALTEVQEFWAHSQGKDYSKVRKYYYRLAEIR